MLSRKFRLRKKEEISRIFQRGSFVSGHDFVFKFLPNKSSQIRVAVIIGKKLCKSAVARNRIRRRLREVVRLNFDSLPTGFDLLVIARTLDLREINFTKLNQDFLTLVQKWISKNS